MMKQQKNSTRGMENKNLAGKKERIKKKVLTGSDLLCLILPQISFVVVFACFRLLGLAWSCLFRLLVCACLSCMSCLASIVSLVSLCLSMLIDVLYLWPLRQISARSTLYSIGGLG